MSYCVWFTCRQHTCGWFSLQKTCSREFYRKKEPVQRTSKQSGQMSVLESRALPLPCNSLSLSASLCLSLSFSSSRVFLSLCQSRQWRSLSSFLRGDTVDVPRAKGNLFCTSSMHHVAVSVDSASRKRERHSPPLQPLQSENTTGIQLGSESVPRIWLLD